MSESREAAVPRSLDDARAELRTYREQLGLAGGCVMAAGLAGSAIGVAAALPLAAVAGVGLGLLYAFPVTERASAARRTIRQWEQARTFPSPDVTDPDDSRLRSAEALLARIEEYAGPAAPPAVSARAMMQVLYDSMDDRAAVGLFRSASIAAPHRRRTLEQRAQSLDSRIQARMDHALDVIAEIYEAVLARDDIALREVIARAEADVDLLQAEEEVSLLLDPGQRREQQRDSRTTPHGDGA